MSHRKRRHPTVKPPAGALTAAQTSLLAAVAAVPALFNIQSGASFEPDKAAMLILLAIIALVDILWRRFSADGASSLAHTASRLKRHPWALLLVGLAVWASVVTALSVDPVTSLWGNYDRGYGLLTLLAGMVFLAVAWDMARSGRYWLLVDAALLGAAIPILYGFVQMLDIDPVRGFGVSFPLGERASSTLGNPLYLGDYLVIVLFLGLARRVLLPPVRALSRRILEIFILAALSLLVLTFSRSAYLGMLAGGASLVFFVGMKAYRNEHRKGEEGRGAGRKWLLPAGLVALFGGAAALVLLWPRLQHGGTIQQRLLIWQGVMTLIRHHPRIWVAGLGFDTMPFRLAPHLSPTLGHFEPDFVFRVPDRAHDLLLDLLVTGGPLWLAGWLMLGGMALWRLGRSRHSLAPWLAAIIIGRGALLLVSFPTHVPDLLFWGVLGMSFGLDEEKELLALRGFDGLVGCAVAAFGVFGFSLSAAWPGGLLLWLLAMPPLLGLLYALAPHFRFPTHYLVLTIFIMPAILLNQSIGPAAQFAWLWLLLWMSALIFVWPWPDIHWGDLISSFALVVILMVPVTLPRLGDIAYKSSVLTLDGTQFGEARRDSYLAKAIRLAPYDHVMYSGMAWVMSQRLPPTDAAYAPRAERIARLYLSAMASQPNATEPPAALARWLAHLAASDPRRAGQAQDAFHRALTLSPNDIQTLNDQAMFWASMGRADKAIAELNRLLRLDPLYGPTYLHLSQVYQQIDDEDAAQAAIDRGKEKVPWWDAWDAY